MTSHDPPRTRGRPATLDPAERARRILDAFEEGVARHGLAGATMDVVALEAGMSKRTLYAVFGSRAALFDAWVAQIGKDLVRPLSSEQITAPLRERLRAMLRREVETAASARRLTVLRALIAEAPRHPAPSRSFLEHAANSARARLGEELGRAAERGEISPVDPQAAACLLLDMACLNPLDWLLDPGKPAPSPQTTDARLDLALRVFLAGSACRDSG